MHKFYLVTLILFCSSPLCAQELESSNEDKEPKETKHALGLLLSLDTGVGFSYRFIPDRFGFQVSTLPLYANWGSGFYYQYIGGSLQYRIHKGEKLDVYSYIGTNGVFIVSGGIHFDYHIAGAGAGVDIKLFKHFSLQLQGGYAFNLREHGVFLDKVETFFSPGIGVLYNF